MGRIVWFGLGKGYAASAVVTCAVFVLVGAFAGGVATGRKRPSKSRR